MKLDCKKQSRPQYSAPKAFSYRTPVAAHEAVPGLGQDQKVVLDPVRQLPPRPDVKKAPVTFRPTLPPDPVRKLPSRDELNKAALTKPPVTHIVLAPPPDDPKYVDPVRKLPPRDHKKKVKKDVQQQVNASLSDQEEAEPDLGLPHQNQGDDLSDEDYHLDDHVPAAGYKYQPLDLVEDNKAIDEERDFRDGFRPSYGYPSPGNSLRDLLVDNGYKGLEDESTQPLKVKPFEIYYKPLPAGHVVVSSNKTRQGRRSGDVERVALDLVASEKSLRVRRESEAIEVADDKIGENDDHEQHRYPLLEALRALKKSGQADYQSLDYGYVTKYCQYYPTKECRKVRTRHVLYSGSIELRKHQPTKTSTS